jgi:hypothetical protein
MPRETYRVTPPRDASLQTLQRFAMEVNDVLEAISRREAALEGRDGTLAQFQSNLQLNNHRVCGVGRSQQDDEAVPRVELVDRALYARRDEHIAQFPLRVKKLKIVEHAAGDDSGVPLAQIRELAESTADAAAVGTSADTEVLYNKAGVVDGVEALTWDGSVLVLQAPADSVTFFQILDADGGTPVVNVDTTNERLGVGTAAPSQPLHVVGNVLVDTGTLILEQILTLLATATSDTAPDDDTTRKKLTLQRLSAAPTNAAYIQFSNGPGTPTNELYLVLEEG